jgi:hypothetical protein
LVTVNWTAPTDTGGATIISYRVRAFTGTSTIVARTVTATASARNAVVRLLTNGQPYSFEVTPIYLTGTGTSSARSGLATPRAA